MLIRTGPAVPPSPRHCSTYGPAAMVRSNGRVPVTGANRHVPAAPAGGRLALPGLAGQNVLVVEAEVADGTLARFTDPSDGAGYLPFTGYPTQAPSLFCCFDQADLTATTTLSLVLPAGWDCLTTCGSAAT